MIPQATIVRSAVLRTSAAQRPYPSLFYYPGLRSRAMWKADYDTFPWLKTIKDNINVIQKEYEEAMKALPNDYVPGSDEQKLHSGSWSWQSFITKGIIQPAFQITCPETTGILQSIPGLMADKVPFAHAFFSTLKAGSEIDPHYGPCNIRLRVHVPLRIPNASTEKCGMKLADETFQWELGKPIVFDDCYLHSVWNKSVEDRVVLLFDIWHPDISDSEKAAVIAMFDEARSKGWLK